VNNVHALTKVKETKELNFKYEIFCSRTAKATSVLSRTIWYVVDEIKYTEITEGPSTSISTLIKNKRKPSLQSIVDHFHEEWIDE
jgi:hypothetical protein